MTEIELRNKYVKAFSDLVGKCAEGGAEHKALLDTYNTLNPLPRGVKMVASYDWCAATVTAIAIRCGLLNIFVKECSCTKQIEQWKAKGAWVENDAYIPKTGDIVYFAWDAPASGDFTADVDHVGVVEKVEEGYIISIEGNKGNNVNRRTFPVNYRYIRGFATPDYASLADKTEDKPMTYSEEFERAKELGITDGTNPDQPATRKQVAVMIYRAIKIVLSLIGKVEV